MTQHLTFPRVQEAFALTEPKFAHHWTSLCQLSCDQHPRRAGWPHSGRFSAFAHNRNTKNRFQEDLGFLNQIHDFYFWWINGETVMTSMAC